jgi:hypothetical protein
MGRFANEMPGQGMIGPDTYSKGNDGFAALGKPVPFWRQAAGYEHAKAMGLDSGPAFEVVAVFAEQIKRDAPHAAMEAGLKYLDATGVYRLLAVMLTAEKIDEAAVQKRPDTRKRGRNPRHRRYRRT